MKFPQPDTNPKDLMMYSEDKHNGLAIFNDHTFSLTVVRNKDESFKDFSERIVKSMSHCTKVFQENEYMLTEKKS